MDTPSYPPLHGVPQPHPRLHPEVSEEDQIVAAWEAAMSREGFDLDTSIAGRELARTLAEMDFLALVFNRAEAGRWKLERPPTSGVPTRKLPRSRFRALLALLGTSRVDSVQPPLRVVEKS